jgi:hypothetical protein
MALILRPPGSSESLTERISGLGRARKWTAAATGLFTVTVVVAASIALVAILDASFHLGSLPRGFALVAILATAAILWVRGVWRSVLLPTDPVTVALELEDSDPALNDALASAVTFMVEDAAERGVSDRLQRVAVRSAHRLVDRHDFSRLIPTGACWRAGWSCAIVLGALLPLVLLNPGRATTALVRLADPFGVHPWPTNTSIELLAPERLPARMPRGEAFVLKFNVRGVIPDRASVEFRLNSGEEFQEEYPLTGGAETRSTAMISASIDPGRLPASFGFRIIANDADTGWQQVEIVPPPRLVDLNGRPSPQFRITPPEYTGLPHAEVPDGAVVLEMPVGAVVQLRAAADVSLSAAFLSYQGDKSPIEKAAALAAVGQLNPFAAAASSSLALDIGSDIKLEIDEDGRTITGEFSPAMSGTYSLKLVDQSGLVGSRIIELRLLPDPAPIVTMQHPAADKDPTLLTPSSRIPVQITADDKVYGLRRTFLEYRVGRTGIVRIIPLLDVGDFDRSLPAVAGGLAYCSRVRPSFGEKSLLLPIASLKRDDGSPVREGDAIILVGAADDWDDVSVGKQPGRSGEVEIVIAEPEGIEAWLQKELAALRPELFRLRDQEREARQRTGEVAPLSDGTLAPMDRDKLLAAEQQQRLIRGKISDPRDGLRAKAELLRETALLNRLPRSNTTDRVARVADELNRLAERDLNPIEANLNDARVVGGQPPRVGQERLAPEHLKKAARHQKAVEDSLSNLLELLAVWGNAAELRGEARLLRDQLNHLGEDAGRLAEKVPAGKSSDALGAAQKAELDRASGRAELAAEQAGSILTRAFRLVMEKEKQAAALKAAAAERLNQRQSLLEKGKSLPDGSLEKSKLNGQAAALELEAEELKSAGDKAAAEAAALHKAIAAAEGEELTNDIRNAAREFKNNQLAQGGNNLKSAAGRLSALTDSLVEKSQETAPDLAKFKQLADDLNALGDAQEELRKRAAAAAAIPDAARRDAELKKLAVQQEKLLEQGKELLQRLTRERADQAARDTRAALDRMESARDDLEKGQPGTRPADQAIERLDNARDQLDAATNNAGQQLSDERRRKMSEKVKALVERQQAALAEADRIHGLISKSKKFERPLQASYGDLAERERALALEVKSLGEKEFAPLPVLARLLADSAAAMESGADKIEERQKDARDGDPDAAFDAELEAANDRKVKRPMAIAGKRLEQLLAVLKEEPPKAGPKPEQPTAKPPASNQSTPGGDSDVIPPLAQLKVLYALQEELNQRTAEFEKLHPDKTKLSDEEQAELRELEQSQRDIALLFQQLAKLFPERQENPVTPEKPDNKDPEKSP